MPETKDRRKKRKGSKLALMNGHGRPTMQVVEDCRYLVIDPLRGRRPAGYVVERRVDGQPLWN